MEIKSLNAAVNLALAPTAASVGVSAARELPPAAATTVAEPKARTTEEQQARSGKQPPEKEVKAAVELINKTIERAFGSSVQFTIDDETKINLVKVVDTKSQEVIRQFPSDEALQIAKTIDRLQGLLIKDTA